MFPTRRLRRSPAMQQSSPSMSTVLLRRRPWVIFVYLCWCWFVLPSLYLLIGICMYLLVSMGWPSYPQMFSNSAAWWPGEAPWQKYFTSSQEVNKELHKHLRCTKQRQESKRMFQNHLCQIHTPIRSQEISEIDETKIIPTQLYSECFWKHSPTVI